jgi:hypothetical protein
LASLDVARVTGHRRARAVRIFGGRFGRYSGQGQLPALGIDAVDLAVFQVAIGVDA